MKVLTAFDHRHIKYLHTCINSTGCTHLIRFDEGKGKAYAMNDLLKQVHDNDWVAVLDADDIALPAMFDKTDADVIYGDYIELETGKKVISKPFDFDGFKEQNFIPYSGTLIRGKFAKTQYPDIWHGNDWLWWWRMIHAGAKFEYLPGARSIRRIRTSYKRCRIPVYRKWKRLQNDKKVKKQICGQ